MLVAVRFGLCFFSQAVESDNVPNKCTISAPSSVSGFQNSQPHVKFRCNKPFPRTPAPDARLLGFGGSRCLPQAAGSLRSAGFLRARPGSDLEDCSLLCSSAPGEACQAQSL